MENDDFFNDLNDFIKELEKMFSSHFRPNDIIKESFEYKDKISITLFLPSITKVLDVRLEDNIIEIDIDSGNLTKTLKMTVNDNISLDNNSIRYSFSNGVLDIEIDKQ